MRTTPHLVLVAVFSFPKGRKESCQSLRQVEFLDVRLSLAVALNIIQVTVRFFISVPPQFSNRRNFKGLPPLFPSTNLTRGLNTRLNNYLESPLAAKALCIYKLPRLLWDSNADPTAQQSASPTTIREG
ncbi:hypothetical protein TNCV_3723971 [Trichonephila clavipes]|nr:hypothetical protein TNCV_3723971 [Trichonephila clavipes]